MVRRAVDSVVGKGHTLDLKKPAPKAEPPKKSEAPPQMPRKERGGSSEPHRWAEKAYYKWLVMGTTVMALLIILLDVTVVNVATPHIIRDFNASISDIQWAFNSYTIAFAALLIIFGRLGDMFGHKTIFLVGLVFFGVSSALSGASPSIDYLIFFRMLQGIGGAMMMPATLALTLSAFPPHQRGMALGFWGAMAGLALAIGPVLGGFIVDNYSWRWIFYINIPVVLLALFLTTFFIHQKKEALRSHKLDVWGFLTISSAIVALTYAIIEGQKYGWNSHLILGLFAASGFLLLLFLFIEIGAAEPMVNLSLFRDRNFSIGSLLALLITFSMLGTFFLVPLFLQQILGFSAIKTGLTITPLAIAMLIIAPNVGRLSDRFGGRWFLVFGMLIVSVALWMFGDFSATTTQADLILPFVVFGVGMACIMPVMINVALDRVPPAEYGSGSGVVNTFRQLGGVLGVSIMGVVFSSQLSHNVIPAVQANSQIPQQTQTQIISQFSGGNVELAQTSAQDASQQAAIKQLPADQQPAAEQKLKEVSAQVAATVDPAVAKSTNNTFRFSIIFTLIGAFLCLFVRNEPKAKHPRAAKPTAAEA
jgi:EmrB/QacA subfamily drug resistance transporter